MLRLLKTLLFCSACVGLSLALNACSLSTSSGSLSTSSNSLSTSSDSFSTSAQSLSRSSTSLASSKSGAQYEGDVLDYTYAYLKSTSSAAADYDGFLKGLSDIAAKHGIADWEADTHTYLAIGKALKKARIEGVSYEAYKKNFAGADADKMRDIQKGYESGE